MRLTNCSILLSLNFILFTALRPHLKKHNDSLLSCDKGNISLLLSLDFFLLILTLLTTLTIQQLTIFLEFLALVLNGFFLPFQQEFCGFYKQLLFYFFFPILSSSGFVLDLLFLFFIFLNSQELFHHFLFRINFMLMTLTSSYHFLSMPYLLLSLIFFLHW